MYTNDEAVWAVSAALADLVDCVKAAGAGRQAAFRPTLADYRLPGYTRHQRERLGTPHKRHAAEQRYGLDDTWTYIRQPWMNQPHGAMQSNELSPYGPPMNSRTTHRRRIG